MQANQIPAKFSATWANAAGSGYTRTIPVASQASITPGAASLADGFPPLCFLPVGSGGIPPSGQDFNGILAQTTAWLRWQGAGGTVTYDATFATAIGGYPVGAIVQSATAGKIWLNTADNNLTNPDSASSANWVGLSPSAAKVPFNEKIIPLPTRVAMSVPANSSGVFATGAAGLAYTKLSSTSRLVVQGSYTCFSPIVVGQGNAAITQRLRATSGAIVLYDEAPVVTGFFVTSGAPCNIGANPLFAIDGLPAGALTLDLLFKRDDSAAWQTVMNATGADQSGLPTPNPGKLLVKEEEI